ncbi:hypothetical protein AMJ49_05390 [Parcubacteria bacterium DG_74_2]|nr:MAG: hypothetical protein AMJ49_05390 [Parcubacteria bacterium DG_74_2]
MKKFIAYVTVRLNSKRVPLKSIQKIGGKPLINHTIFTLKQVKEISDILLYCSQEKIQAYINPNLSYTFIKRPIKFDSDFATFNEILDSIIDKIETDYIVFICCTSPFIKPEAIKEMIYKIANEGYDSAFTAHSINNFCWYQGKPLNYNPSNVPRTQDLQPVIAETSGLYIFSKELFKKYKRRIGFKPYIKIVDIFEGWDIDTINDLKMAKLIHKIIHKK